MPYLGEYRIVVVGSRSWDDYPLLERMLDRFLARYKGQEHPLLISGGAVGADTLAERYAHEHALPISVMRPDYETDGKGATFKRNWKMVHLADVVLAFWDEASRGTLHTLNTARASHVTAWVLTPDGRHYRWQGEDDGPCANGTDGDE